MQIANILQPNFAKRALKPRTPRAKQVFHSSQCRFRLALCTKYAATCLVYSRDFTIDHPEKMTSQIFLGKTALIVLKGILMIN